MNTNLKIAILGAGESGVGTALLAKAKGFDVFVSDKSEIKQKYISVLEANKIAFESGKHTEDKLLNSDLVMKSPGIPERVPLVKAFIEKGIPVLSEIEFADRYTNATIIAVTGSNGKTTTASLIHHVLTPELSVGLGGNIGASFAQQVLEKDFPNYVLELSSFQLDGCYDFKPKIAVITNISPDHLDRYDYDYSKYIASKFRITQNQTSDDYLIYDADDEVIQEYISSHNIKAILLPFSLTKKVENGAYYDNEEIIVTINNTKFNMSVQDLALKGKHNVKNAMATASVAQLLKIRKQTIRQSLADFHGVEHRLERVLKINKVQYINDSKATNVNAAYYALESMQAPTVWIVGGVDKGNDYTELFQFINEKVKAIICLGVDNAKLKENFAGMVDDFYETETMVDAVNTAYKLAEGGDNVLLSPACASFDLFENYEDRGRQFKEAIRNL